MEKRGETVERELLLEFLRHLLAHSSKINGGRGQRGCQFCPTLKVKPGSSQRVLLHAELFPERFYRSLAKDLNKIERLARKGHREATQFMKRLERMFDRPWDKPPSSPGALLSAPLSENVVAA